MLRGQQLARTVSRIGCIGHRMVYDDDLDL
jgi:hypothetical protein